MSRLTDEWYFSVHPNDARLEQIGRYRGAKLADRLDAATTAGTRVMRP